MKNRIAALSLTLALSVGLCAHAYAAETPFSDVPADHWAYSSISEMAEKGIMSGIGNGLFAPDKPVTYAEFGTMLVRQFYADQIKEVEGAWYAPYMAVAYSVNLLNGVGYWKNEEPLTRYDMALYIRNALLDKKDIVIPMIDMPAAVANDKEFPWVYRDAVTICYGLGILSGVDSSGSFNGDGTVTRAQAAVAMDRLLDVPDVPSIIPPKSPVEPLNITSVSQFTSSDAIALVVKSEGEFFFDSSTPGLGMYPSCMLGIDTEKYRALTFTIQALDDAVTVSVTHSRMGVDEYDPNAAWAEELGFIPAGTSKTFTVDCSEDISAQINLGFEYGPDGRSLCYDQNPYSGELIRNGNPIAVDSYLRDITLS